MKEKLKRVFSTEISRKLVALGAVAALAIVLLPIVRIMTYCVPWYDDFSYGDYTKSFWELKYSFADAVKGALYNTKTLWYAWQGTFTSCFFMSMMPAVWGPDKYVYGLWAVLAVLLIGIFALVKVLLFDVLKCEDRWNCLTVQSVAAITVVLFMRSAIEGFFWYNSAVHYTAMHGLGMLFIAGLIRLVYADGKVQKLLLFLGSILGAGIVGGVNNVTALQVGLVMMSILGFGIVFRKKSVLRILPATICYMIALGINLGAPGNDKRMVFFADNMMTPVEAIWCSFQSAITYFWDFTGWSVIAIFVLMVPVAWQVVSKVQFEFRYPWLVLLWSFCLYASGFAPTLYVMRTTLLGRATNMTKVTFQILLFINLFYLVGSAYKYLEKKSKHPQMKNTWSFYIVMMIVMVTIFALEPNKGGVYSSYCAYYFVHTGEAYNYYQEYLKRVEICESDEADVVVHPYVFKPWLLCLGDLSDNPEDDPNRFMANFYDKNSITCIAPEEDVQE